MPTRRELLQHLGLGLALAPFLGRVPESLASGTVPKRLVLIPSLNGGSPDLYYPTGGGPLPVITAAFEPWRDRVQLIRGLDMDGSWDHMAVRSMYTGAWIPNYEAPDPAVRSVDQVIASHLAGCDPTARRSVHLAARPADHVAYYQAYGRSTFFFDPQPVDYEANPVTAFDGLFGGLGGAAPDPDLVASRLDEAIRGVTVAELDDLALRVRRLPTEAAKVARHLAALPPLSGDVVPTAAGCVGDPLASVEALRPVLQGSASAAYTESLFGEILDAQIDVLARVLTCGLTRVATLQYNSADGNVGVPVAPGVLLAHHNTSHGAAADFAQVQAWYAGKIARLLGQLDVPDPLDPGGGTVLDNTVLLWMNECNSNHDAHDVPCLYIGSAGGSLVTGGVTEVETTNKVLMRTLCEVFGVPGGSAAHFGTQVLSEVLA